ncbi:NifB/NifX family molybdenum-iron cluster-binding protein [Desulfoferula mesophila]|uniref:Nitrogenase cofactor biosynthesis protein NifB n=1 Tax=Desulfoferula mesophila TaxID=3058419 RepID=A0AAU9EPW0_9BACT|nr:nitrogenase cofactor biosynthesis protein NifB [Desulfoferula mesophilus]
MKPVDHQSAENYCADNLKASGRVHLPTAPKALARGRFSPEAALPRALTPDQALNWLEYLAGQGHRVKVINLNGPGDPMATPELTLLTLNLLRDHYPGVSLCLTTLGIGAAAYAKELARQNLAHVSILMDAVEPEVAQGIYAWIRPGTKTLPLAEAAALLVAEQAAAIQALAEAGVRVLVKTTVYPGINSQHIAAIAAKAAELGASEMKLFPFVAKGEDSPRPRDEATPEELSELAAQANKHLPTILMDLATCQEMIENEFSAEVAEQAVLPKPSPKRPHLAVCSSDGFVVDTHLGQAYQFLIYGPKNGPVSLLEARPAPEPGAGDGRWQQVALLLSDCFAVLASAAGENPKRILAEKGLAVLTQEGNVEGLVDVLYGGGKKKGGKK